ncbi:hypothetical protein [Mucilaginibacter sp. AK015]|uniref:hypothetical protein n=1 Tax=Mucilaginibacter sp. AK015 TaxID=2723072 RepID=UPI00160BA328|nr:hypothetical protein [Mucilaginibacter sp. AK015]MBB5397188.1 hypothetical protein [Mucilaginibacter sp. AK015]
MNFKAYAILSSLVPGFLILLALQHVLNVRFDKDLVVAYTAVAFLFGYIMNTASSWLEGFYFWTWGGKPSSNLLKGKGIWKVKFYESEKAMELLSAESWNASPGPDELFSIAMRHANGEKDSRVEDFNALYAFSRVLLTTSLIGGIPLIVQSYHDWRYYLVVLPVIIILWLRCKQRGYYYSKEVLNSYLKKKAS